MGVLNEATSTRLKFGLVIVIIVGLEAAITAFVPGFPFIAAAGIQAGIYTTYVTGRTITGVKADSVTVTHEDQ